MFLMKGRKEKKEIMHYSHETMIRDYHHIHPIKIYIRCIPSYRPTDMQSKVVEKTIDVSLQ